MSDWVNTVLFGGPFDGEGRDIAVDSDGCPPAEVKLLDAIATMEIVMGTNVGEDVPITYQAYKRVGCKCTGAGIWRYEYSGTYLGRFSIGNFESQ